MAGSNGADVMIADPTALCYVRRGIDDASLFSKCEGAKHNKHVLNGATMVPGGDYFWASWVLLLRASCRVLLMLLVLLVL